MGKTAVFPLHLPFPNVGNDWHFSIGRLVAGLVGCGEETAVFAPKWYSTSHQVNAVFLPIAGAETKFANATDLNYHPDTLTRED